MMKQTGLAQPGEINSVPKGVHATKDVYAKSEKPNDYCLWRASRKGNRKYTYDKSKIFPGIVYWLGFGVKCNR
jgi:hypothetical protein